MALPNAIGRTIVEGTAVALSNSATGDVYSRDSAGLLTRLPIGTAGQVLAVGSG